MTSRSATKANFWGRAYPTMGLPGSDVPVYLLDHEELFGRGYLYDPPGGVADRRGTTLRAARAIVQRRFDRGATLEEAVRELLAN